LQEFGESRNRSGGAAAGLLANLLRGRGLRLLDDLPMLLAEGPPSRELLATRCPPPQCHHSHGTLRPHRYKKDAVVVLIIGAIMALALVLMTFAGVSKVLAGAPLGFGGLCG